MANNALKHYSSQLSEDMRQGSLISYIQVAGTALLPSAVIILVSTQATAVNYWSLAGQIVIGLLSMRVVGAFLHYLPETTLCHIYTGLVTGFTLAAHHAIAILSHYFPATDGLRSFLCHFFVFAGLFAVGGALSGWLVNRLPWPWLQRTVENLVDSFFSPSEPPKNCGGFPMTLRSLVYNPEERKRFAANNPFSFETSSIFVTLAVLAIIALPGLSFLTEELSLFEATLEAVGAWFLTVGGLSWATRCLEPRHANLLVSSLAFGAPLLFYRMVGSGPLDAILVGLGGFLLSRVVYLACRWTHCNQ